MAAVLFGLLSFSVNYRLPGPKTIEVGVLNISVTTSFMTYVIICTYYTCFSSKLDLFWRVDRIRARRTLLLWWIVQVVTSIISN